MKNIYLTKVVQVREVGDPNIEIADKKISSSLDASKILIKKLKLGQEAEENFIILGLDTKNQVNCISLISKGSLNSTIVHPREIFKPAILSNCSSIILAHNHPSGILDPSEEDILVTQRLKSAGRLLGIDVLDHIIVSDKGYFSFKEEDLLMNINNMDSDKVLEGKSELDNINNKSQVKKSIRRNIENEFNL